MRVVLAIVTSAVTSLVACKSTPATAPAPTPVAPTPVAPTPTGRPSELALPGGTGGIGFDDLRFSAALHRVLVPAGRTGNLDLVDPTTLAVTPIGGFTAQDQFGGGHGQGTTSVDTGAGHLFAIDRGSTQVIAIDPTAPGSRTTAALAGPPDYVRWVEPGHEVWVTEPRGEQIEYFTYAGGALAKAGTIAVAGGPESLVIDVTRGRAYTHTWKSETVVIDLASHREIARWPNGCAGARGIALDEPRGLLFVGCEEGKATALDVAHAGAIVGSIAAGAGVDIIAYAPALSHLYVPGGDAKTLTIVGVAPSGALRQLAQVPAPADAHCVTADDQGGVYVCDPGRGALQLVSDRFPATR